MRTRPASLIAVLFAATTLLAGCEGGPNQPTHLDAFRVAGPNEVPPGTDVQFRALLDRVATLSDVSDEAQWTSSNPSVLSLDAGHATGHALGEAAVTARIDDRRTDPKLVLVLPLGTYRMRGTVQTQQSTGLPMALSMARAEVVGLGLSATTDAQGRFALYGVPQDAQIRISKQGFVPALEAVHLSDHERQITRVLRPAIEGTYTMSIGPSVCSGGPGPPPSADLMQRSYTVVLVQTGQNGAQVVGSIPAANVTVVGFSGSFLLPQARWFLTLAIGERLPDGKALTMNGFATIGTDNLTCEFRGRIALNDPAVEGAIAGCSVTGSRFVLTP
jgi:hypothetical protein